MERILLDLFKKEKVRVLIEGPALCGKSQTILNALGKSGRDFVHLTIGEMFGNPILSPASIVEKYITDKKILFIDDIETIFPSRDVDFHFMNRVLSRKPNIIAACRSSNDVHPFVARYLSSHLKMEQRRSDKRSNAPNVSFDDIGGSAKAKELILLMASWSVTNVERVKKWGLTPPSGAILYGPPGTGKTLMAKAAANACHCSFFSVAIPDLLRCEVGESEKRLTKVFEIARADSPSIVFIDEIQALFGKRDEQKTDSNRLVVQLISQLDANAKHGSVFCLAATNALEAVDKALLQPGRFEEVIEMGLPDEQERKEILLIALKSITHKVDDRIQDLAGMTTGMTASDIVGVCQKAATRALMDHKHAVEFNHIKTEIENDVFRRPLNVRWIQSSSQVS